MTLGIMVGVIFAVMILYCCVKVSVRADRIIEKVLLSRREQCGDCSETNKCNEVI